MSLFIGPDPHRKSKKWVQCVPDDVLQTQKPEAGE
jgi:hypothetical protein